MKININVTRNFRVNGKEYHSVEEMPDEVRQVVEKAMALPAGSGQRTPSVVTRSKIIFNGTEYENIDSMPQEARQLYEKMLKAAVRTVPSSGLDIAAGDSRGLPGKLAHTGTADSGDVPKPTKIESSFSPRMLLMSAGLLALTLLFYYLLQSR